MTERVQVDRIEGNRAVLVAGKDGSETISLPARLLPEGTREGTALDLTLVPAPADTTRAEVQDLMDELFADSPAAGTR